MPGGRCDGDEGVGGERVGSVGSEGVEVTGTTALKIHARTLRVTARWGAMLGKPHGLTQIQGPVGWKGGRGSAPLPELPSR